MTRHPARRLLPILAAVSLLLAACSDETSRATQEESAGTPSADAPSSGTTEGANDVRPHWTLLSEEPEGVPLDPGAYALAANGVSDHLAVVEAPEGYQNFGGWTFVTGDPFHAMGFQTAGPVVRDPCGSGRHSKFDAAVNPGPSVRDLAEALVAQEGAETSRPVPATIDGHEGLYLTYRVAKGVDVLKCEGHAFDIFGNGPSAWFLQASRERAAIWILDVDGERLILAWVAVPGVPTAEMREMTRMVRSAHFVAAE